MKQEMENFPHFHLLREQKEEQEEEQESIREKARLICGRLKKQIDIITRKYYENTWVFCGRKGRKKTAICGNFISQLPKRKFNAILLRAFNLP
jgi:hypothetical protein